MLKKIFLGYRAEGSAAPPQPSWCPLTKGPILIQLVARKPKPPPEPRTGCAHGVPFNDHCPACGRVVHDDEMPF